MAKKERDMLAHETKKSGAVFQGALIGAILCVVALVGMFCLVSALLSGCGGGGDNDGPVYNGNGVCVKNCSPDECPECGYLDGEGNCVTDNCNVAGDGSVVTPDGYNGADQPNYGDNGSGPQADTEPYVCPESEPPKACAPVGTWEAKCTYYDGPDANLCDKGAYVGEYCSTDAECQKVPPDAWPPCVCWGLPCLLVGKWECPSGSVMDFTDMEFYDNGDGYCRMHFPQYPSGDLYNKPGDDHVQRPPSGEPVEEKYTVLDNGNQLLGESPDGDGIYFYTCTKLVEE